MADAGAVKDGRFAPVRGSGFHIVRRREPDDTLNPKP